MAAETSRSGQSSESYIGSLISLTSKSEIRYEGILYVINTEESSIGLRNVRSFGTEGRKKDGPQVPANDKIYDYILFRGSDIKDLQVKSSPPAQPASINNDPAIIQSHYPHPAPSSTSMSTVENGNAADISSHTAQLGLPRSTFQGSLPPYQPGGGLGTWGSSPTPTVNGSGLAVPPMYWQGYYGPPSGLPHLQQPTLLRPPPGLPIPHSIQHPFQYPGINPLPSGSQTSLPSGSQISLSAGSQTLPELPRSFPNISSTSALTPSTLPSVLDPSSTSTLSLEMSITSLPNIPPVTTVSAPMFSSNLPMFHPVTSNLERDVAAPLSTPVDSSKPITVPGSNLGYLSVPEPVPLVSVPSNLSQLEKPVTLVTPGQLMQASSSILPSSQLLQTSHTDDDTKTPEAKSKPLLPETSLSAAAEANEPILPLPKSTIQKSNGATHNYYNGVRGRGRGRDGRNEYSYSATKFSEDFDFIAMNEKFNKDEVWDHLGKSKASVDKDGDIREDEFGDTLEEDEEALKADITPVYVKDDFFDSLSCGTLDRGTRGPRTRFSEQLKIDTETFGDLPRYRPTRGGRRGFRGGGRPQGSYYGRGYGYNGRGRGYSHPHRSSS